MSTNINDFVRPTSSASRRDINKILEMIHDIVASEPEDEGQKERISKTSHVRDRNTTVTFGGANLIDTDIRGVMAQVIRRQLPAVVTSYPLDHTENSFGGVTILTRDTKFGAGITFDGIGYISVSDDTRIDKNRTDAISFAFWIKPKTGIADNDIIVNKGNGLTGTGIHIFYDLTNTRIGFRLRNDGGTSYEVFSANGSAPLNAWVHVVCRYDGTSNRDGMTIYINNSLSVTGTSLAITGTLLQNDSFGLGAGGDGSSPMLGDIALLSWVDEEVSTAWITSHFNNLLDTDDAEEIITYNFVGNALPTPDETSGFCVSS